MKGLLRPDEHFMSNTLGVPRRFQGHVIEAFYRPSIFEKLDGSYYIPLWLCGPHFNPHGAY
jgi:hypothetical protein